MLAQQRRRPIRCRISRLLTVRAACEHPAYVENAFVVVLPKKSCRCEAPGCFGYTMGSSGARWLGRQSVKKVWPAARADGRTSTMSSAPRMMTSQGSALGLLPLSVRDPGQTGGPPYPPLLSAYPAVLLESEQRDHSQVLTGTESRRGSGRRRHVANRDQIWGEARTPRGRYRTRRWIGNRSSPVDVSNRSHALHGMPPSAQPGADRRPRISAGGQRSSPRAPITGAAGRRNRVKIAAAMVGHHANKDALHLRLRRIGAQVRGIQRMVEDEA